MDADKSMNGSEDESRSKLTRTERRIVELKDVEENIAILLNLAGCTIASLHPDPLSTFSDSIVSLEDSPESDDGVDLTEEDRAKLGDTPQSKSESTEETRKEEQFSKYAEAYFSTLFDIQRSLRTSIHHLDVSKASAAPLLDPAFASLSNSGALFAAGGVASSDLLKPMPPRGEMKESVGPVESKAIKSIGALRFEKEAIEDLIRAMNRAE